MKYTVKFRDATGALKSEVVEAADKSEALTLVRANGRQPVSILEGGKVVSPITFPSKRIMCGIVGSVIALTFGLFYWIFFGAANKPVTPHPPSARKIVKASKIPAVKVPTTAKVEVTNSVVAPMPVQPKRLEGGVEVVSSTVLTNRAGSVIERLVMADGTTRRKIYPPKPVFKHASDQVIAMCITTKPGQSMPPLPALDKSLEKDFVEAMLEPIEIAEDDSPEVKDLKARVMETRAYLKGEIKSGRTTLLEALREHQRSMEQTADAHTMALQEYQKMRQDGSQQDADEFLKAVNESFKARGIPELTLRDQTTQDSRRGK